MLRYMKIAWRYIKEYRKRSAAMVLSIALGVFLIVTIGSLAESARVLRVNDMRQNTGVNHVFYTGLNNNQIDKIKAHDNVKAAANCFNYDLWKSENGLEVNVLAGEEKILSMLDTKIVEGKYPTEPNEIALEKWVLDRLNLPHQLNENINVSLDEHGEKEFKLVGIVENRLHSQSHDFRDAFVAFNDEYLAGKEDSVETSVEFKEGLRYKNEALQLGKDIGIKDEQITLNEDLLSAMGELDTVDWDLVIIALLLALVGGMVVYSLYSISVLKRVQEYGMMRAICSTKKQILYVILSEIFVVYAAGALLGILAGVFCTYCLKGSTMTSLFTEAQYRLDIISISGFAIKLGLLSALGAILFAGLRGAALANNVSPIEAMRRSSQDKNVNLKGKAGFVEKFMTVTEKVSYKNLKRIGSTFFMFNSFDKELYRREKELIVHEIGDQSPWCDIILNVNMDEPMKNGYTKEQLAEIRKLPQVESVSSKQALYSKLKFNKEKLNKLSGENYIKFMDEEGFVPKFLGDFSFEGDTKDEVIIRNTVLGLSDRDLVYLARIFKTLQGEEIDTSLMKDEPAAVVYIPKTKGNGVPYDAKAKGKYAPVLNLKTGDKIKLAVPKEGYAEGIDNKELLKEHEKYSPHYLEKEFTIIGVVDELPYQEFTAAGTELAPYVYLSENMFEELSGIDTHRVVQINLKENASDQDYEVVKERAQKLSNLFKGTLLADYYKVNKEDGKSAVTADFIQNSIAVILILISGFSIYNNINYNLISRIREHGIMKAIGLTKKQFRRMLRSEGLMYGTISAACSCVLALIVELGYFMYKVYIFPVYVYAWPIHVKQFFIDWKSFLIVIFINLAIGYLATIGPRRQVNKIDITEAIRAVE